MTKDYFLSPIIFLKRTLSSYRLQIVKAFFSIILSVITTLIAGIGLRYLSYYEFSSQNPENLSKILSGLVIIILLMAIASFGRTYYMTWIGERCTTDIRSQVFNHLLNLDISFYENKKIGELISRLTTDTILLKSIITGSGAVALRNLLLLIGGLIMMLLTSAMLTFYSLIFFSFLTIPIIFLGRRVKQRSIVFHQDLENITSFIEEIINNIRTVQAFNHEKIDKGFFLNLSEKTFNSSINWNWARSCLVSVIIILVFSCVSFVIWLGIKDIINHHMTIGDLSAFIFYAAIVTGVLSSSGEIISDFQKALAALERIIEILSIKSNLSYPLQPKTLPYISRGTLAVHNVSFTYPTHSDQNILERVTLSVAPGENLAIVGPSGAGKSTLFSLLLRFYDPQAGTIYFDGINIKEVSINNLRSKIGIVPQEINLFSTSIYENILYGNPQASVEKVWKAVNMAYVDEFIPFMPHGIQTIVGPKGVKLSGGQKQRIALARAILKDPSLLLLDEATNALDAKSEQAVQSSLKHLMASRTTIIIAHRLATVLKADRIVVLDRGQIKAVGNHAELISSNELYRNLATLQFSDTVSLKKENP